MSFNRLLSPPPPLSDEGSIITIKKERWIFKLLPSPTTTPVLISYLYVKTKSLLKNIRKNWFLTLPFTVQFTKQERLRLPHIDHRVEGTWNTWLLIACAVLLLIHDLICSIARVQRQVGRLCSRALSHAIARRSWLTNLITHHDSPLQHGSSPSTLLFIPLLSEGFRWRAGFVRKSG